jgi:hypothetical protein
VSLSLNRSSGARARHGVAVPMMVILVAALGWLIASTDEQFPLAMAFVAVGIFLGLLFILACAKAEDVHFLASIFVLGVLLRCVIALMAHYLIPHGTFAYDDGRYNEVGRQLAAYWRHEGGYPEYIRHTNQTGWFYVNGAITWLFGFVPLVPAFLNCVVGSVTALFVFGIARDHFDRPSALRAGLFAMFFPSVMLWSSINLKDAATTLCIVVVLWSGLRLQRGINPLYLFLLILFMTLLGTLRSYLFVLTGVSVVASLMIGRLGVSPRGFVLALVLMVAFVAVYQRFGFGREVVESEGLKTATQIRADLAQGGSAYEGDVEVSSPAKAIAFLPVGLGYFLLAPAPWQIFNLRQALTLPEMILWYCLIPAMVRGVRYALRHHFRVAVGLLGPGVVLTVSYALVEANLGTAYRHRAQVLVIYLIFAAVGLAHRRERAEATSQEASETATHAAPPRAAATV